MFNYTTEIIDNLEKAISPERLSTYLDEAGGNREEALKLYLWNSEVSAAFYISLQSLEITLRNSLNNALKQAYSCEDWYKHAPLDNRGKQMVIDAEKMVKRTHGVINPPHVIAELSFGFWLSLLNKKYHQKLWIPHLNKAFPNARLKRAIIMDTFDKLRTLRNRIAHHEPIFKRDLELDYSNIMVLSQTLN